MDTSNYRRFFNETRELAQWIVAEKNAKRFEADAEIILCCALGALATKLWPGRGIDQRRFVQLLVDFGKPETNLVLISTPALYWQLREGGDVTSAIHLANHFYPGDPKQTLSPIRVDRDETEILTAFQQLDLKLIRRASYASIIYNDLRCGLVHEYDISAPMTSFDFNENRTTPSYFNITDELDQTRTLLHLPFVFIVDTLDRIAESLFNYWDTASHWEQAVPVRWWIDA
jgi:hypothetical protein